MTVLLNMPLDERLVLFASRSDMAINFIGAMRPSRLYSMKVSKYGRCMLANR